MSIGFNTKFLTDAISLCVKRTKLVQNHHQDGHLLSSMHQVIADGFLNIKALCAITSTRYITPLDALSPLHALSHRRYRCQHIVALCAITSTRYITPLHAFSDCRCMSKHVHALCAIVGTRYITPLDASSHCRNRC